MLIKKCFVCGKPLPVNIKKRPHLEDIFHSGACKRLFYRRAEAPENGFKWRGENYIYT